MPVCARAVVIDGQLVLALDPTAPDLSVCPYVVEDGGTNAWRELGNMSYENATDISLSIGVVWAICWGTKTIARALRSIDEKEL